MGRQIPGFGGLYYDGQGRPNVYLLDPDGAGRSALKSLGAQVVVHVRSGIGGGGGGTDQQGFTTFVFSPLENIEEELGPLKVN